MARTKVKTDPELQSWSDVDEALRKIGEAETWIAEKELELTRLVTQAKADSEELVKPLQTLVKTLGTQIKEFVSAHREELDGKTRQLNHGKTGFRLSSKCVVPKGREGDVIAKLRALGLVDCINTKESSTRMRLSSRQPT